MSTVIGLGSTPGRIGVLLVKNPVLQQQAMRNMGASLETAFAITLAAPALFLVFALMPHVTRWHLQSRICFA